MGYRDDLYRPVHMIGYTGQLNARPTAYFFNPEDGSYGHITQEHKYPANIGREGVRNEDSYAIANEVVDGVLRNVERRHGKPFHTSRNPFVPIFASKFFPDAESDFRALALLARVIADFPEMKQWSAMGANARRDYLRRFKAT